MATVRDLSGNITIVDHAYNTPQRTNAGSPVSSLTPAYVGEIIVDTTNRITWRAYGTANTEWTPIVMEH